MLPTVDTRRARRAERIAGGRVRPTASEGRGPTSGVVSVEVRLCRFYGFTVLGSRVQIQVRTNSRNGRDYLNRGCNGASTICSGGVTGWAVKIFLAAAPAPAAGTGRKSYYRLFWLDARPLLLPPNAADHSQHAECAECAKEIVRAQRA